jgi:hypothetical protein
MNRETMRKQSLILRNKMLSKQHVSTPPVSKPRIEKGVIRLDLFSTKKSNVSSSDLQSHREIIRQSEIRNLNQKPKGCSGCGRKLGDK